ncbi:MAG: acetyl-CoA carboxylase biotin carboxyl carrier protein [Candidatus Krumholzibacteriota bacterium]|nr:acetyl-CoA carboxylase biotin carboxyl carrier protein [Candidatus Krumholzibacteriota bacterium]
MIFDRISKLIDIMNSEGLDEIEVRKFFTSIRLVKNRASLTGGEEEGIIEPARIEFKPQPIPDEAGENRTEDLPAEPQVEKAAENIDIPSGPSDEKGDGFEQIVSPMVGTFYQASGPEKEPFVEIGSVVEAGQVVCIIEAMKLMNEIESDRNGIVRKILVKDSQPVEFGQPLFLIEPA